MPLDSMQAITSAYNSGRVHTQRFFKNQGVGNDSQWADWAYSSGQPAYDSRIGTSLEFTPQVATGNKAIWFPPISAGQERRIAKVSITPVPSAASVAMINYVLYDLLGVIPLIDGDSTDLQVVDNTLPLPRYTDGVGVQAVLVNHVAPPISVADFTINSTFSDDTTGSYVGRARLAGLGKASWSVRNSAGVEGSYSPLGIPMAGGKVGVKQINSIQFGSAPGGLWCIYLIKPLMNMAQWTDAYTVPAIPRLTVEKDACLQMAGNMPRVYDGAHLGFFHMATGSSRLLSLLGEITFIWG